ncbi:RCC1 repeat-containing protein C10F6.04 [Pleurostoma richardsiae]|uniref:RCC1 repeat-containing protein C10F6.04 n=1 Tax=Pleurostoma richardsiae TaxID=41990 RepID=A0AA38VHZ5_9PEZI|nr:RCC1 repeat-containing protein C10F6.04 [Pleurostoma richardsiae]
MNVVFAIGSNGSGQLGIGHKQDVSVPKQVLFAEPPSSPVTRVAAGGNHTLVLTQAGELFWSGDPSTGACGVVSPDVRQSSASEPQFQRVLLSKAGSATKDGPVRLVAATWEASVVVQADEQGRCTRVSSMGAGLKGELGQGPLVVRTPAASAVAGSFPPVGTEVVDLAACMAHVVAVLDNGEVYGWGNGRKGQLGTPEAVVDEPRKIENVPFIVRRAVCGKEFTCLFGNPEVGEMLVLGSDKWGVKSSAPTTMAGWKEVGASWGSVFVLKADGSLISWGRNDHGQLQPPKLPALRQIAVGSEHVVALTQDEEVLAWGWGEHGNCGPQVQDGDVKGRWNIIAAAKYIPKGSKFAAVGAGCATTWISIDMPS